MKCRISLLFIFVILIVGCGTNKKLSNKKNLTYLSKNRVLDSISNNTLDFSSLLIRKAAVSVNIENTKQSFSSSIRCMKDSVLLMSINAPLGIELFRVQLTTDSVFFIDFLSKHYLKASYSDFNEKLGVTINYAIIQNLLFNNLYSFISPEKDFEELANYKYSVTPKAYEFTNIQERALSRKVKQHYKGKISSKNTIIIKEALRINPLNYKVNELILDDYENMNYMSLKYNNFKQIDNVYLPYDLDFLLNFNDKKYDISLSYSKIELNIPFSSKIKIPSRYKEIRLNK